MTGRKHSQFMKIILRSRLLRLLRLFLYQDYHTLPMGRILSRKLWITNKYHDILLQRILHLGVCSMQMFKSYLSDRSQYVRIWTSTSSHLPLTCGIPREGSALSPFLFTIYTGSLYYEYPNPALSNRTSMIQRLFSLFL